VNRAPLINPPRGTANIKALLSHDDWFADLDPEDVKAQGKHSDPRVDGGLVTVRSDLSRRSVSC